eukprot:6775822-Prymnesium_polylepis.2
MLNELRGIGIRSGFIAWLAYVENLRLFRYIIISIPPSCCTFSALTKLVLMRGRYGATTLLQLQTRKALNTWGEFVVMMAGAATKLEAAVAALSPRGCAHLNTNNCTQAHQPAAVMHRAAGFETSLFILSAGGCCAWRSTRGSKLSGSGR